MKCPLGISNFLEEISSLSHAIAFLYFLVLITEEGFLISPCYSLEHCIQIGVSFCFSLPFASSFFSYLIKPSQETILPSCISFSRGWFWSLPPIQCYKPKSEFCNKELVIWVRVSSQSCFCWLYRASPSSVAKKIINLILVLTILWCSCIELSCVVGRGYLLWLVLPLGKILLAFALLYFVLQDQTCLLL